jgi:hypothetical protein
MQSQKSNISELLFTRCLHWNTRACPHRSQAEMGLSAINQLNLYVLSDRTVAALNALCGNCSAFSKKAKRPGPS